MFLENNYARPLFDNSEGGPPKAFQCLQCSRVTRTESGMRMHLKSKHQWEEQPCLYSTDDSKRVNDLILFPEREKRLRSKVAASRAKEKRLKNTASMITRNTKSQEMKGEELLPLMNEEK